MKKRSSISFVSLLVLASFAFLSYGQESGVGGSAFHKNDITYSTEEATPHVNWSLTFPAVLTNSSFFPSVQHGRAMVALMHPLSLHPTTSSLDRTGAFTSWGM